MNWEERRLVTWIKQATDEDIKSHDIVKPELNISCYECGTLEAVYHIHDGAEYSFFLCFGCAKAYQQKELPTGTHSGNGLRFRVLARDDFRCVYCGRTPKNDGVVLEVDHVYPKSKGGKDTMDNLVTACRDCNQGKKDMVLG